MQLHKRQKLRRQAAETIAEVRRRCEEHAARLTCPVHARTAVVRVTGDRLEALDIKIEGCCREFVETVRQSLRSVL